MGFDGQFLIVGHRGAAGLAPENTLASFRRAAALGVDAVELDVHLVEGELVVIHDDAVDRTTNGRGKLADFTLADLRQLDVGGERIPLLQEVLEALPAEVGVNVELKGKGTGAALGRRFPAKRDILTSSFDLNELAAFRAEQPDARCAPLFHRRQADMLDVAQAVDAWSIHIADRVADDAVVENIRAAGFRVLAYTVNDPARAERLAALGARGIFTDRPDILCRAAGR